MVEFGQVYLDASVIVAATLDQPGALRGVRWASAVSSELIVAELLRTVDRLRLASSTPDAELPQLREEAERNLAKLDLVPITRAVLRRAGGAFPMPVKTLDAIHLATALLWEEHAGEIVTGLIYIEEDPGDMHDRLQTVDKPLNQLTDADIVPGAAALAKINASLR